MNTQNLEIIKEGYYVDAKDKQGQWLVGLILTVTKNQVRIRFDGYSSKYDQVFPINSQRIKPFRSVLKGNTGPKKIPGIREHWNFSIQNLEQRIGKFQQFACKLGQKSPYEVTQYYRGENYFFIDFLLSVVYNNIEELRRVYDYFIEYIKFVKFYLERFINEDSNQWFQAGQLPQGQIKKAFSEIHYELFDSLHSILGLQTRFASFNRLNQKLIKELIQPETSYEEYMTDILNDVGFLEIFQRFITKIYNETYEKTLNLPFNFILSILFMECGIERLTIPRDFKEKQFNNMFFVVLTYMDNFTIADVKSNQKYIEQILWLTKLSVNRLIAQKEPYFTKIDLLRLKLWKCLIECQVLEKKLRGITKIKQFYEQIVNTGETAVYSFSRKLFKQWLEDEQLFKTIFQTNEHSEVIKKGCEMIQCFYASRLMSMQEIGEIAGILFNKHEAVKKIVFQFWTDLAEVVRKEDFPAFMNTLTQNENKINEEWEMEAVLLFFRSLKNDQSHQGLAEFVSMLYRKIVYHQKFLSEFAKQLSYIGGQTPILKTIIDDCLTSISKKYEPIFHLKLLTRIFHQLEHYKIYVPDNIIEVLIDELKELVMAGQNDKLILSVFNLFNEIMTARNVSAEGQSTETTAKLTFSHLEKLWQIFCNTPYQLAKNAFYGWILIRNFSPILHSSTYMINNRLSHEFKLEIFSNILCDSNKLDYRRMDLNQFLLFKEFMLYANFKSGAIEYKHHQLHNNITNRKTFKVKSQDVQGVAELWEIFQQCTCEEAINPICSFIKDIYLRVSKDMPSDFRRNRTIYLMQLIGKFFKESWEKKNHHLLSRTLILMTKILIDIKEEILIPKEFQRLQKSEKIPITILFQGREPVTMYIFTQQPFVNVKKAIGDKFKLQKHEFTLFNCEKGEVAKQVYELPYYMLWFKQNTFKLILQRSVSQTDFNVSAFVLNAISENFFLDVINLLNDQHVYIQAYQMLEHLDIKETLTLFRSLSKDIKTTEEIVKHKDKIYFHIYFLKVFAKSLQKDVVQNQTIIIQKLICHLQIPIQSSLVVKYLQKIIQILNSFLRKHREFFVQNPQQAPNLSSKLQKLLLNVILHANRSPQNYSNLELRLISQCLSLHSKIFDYEKQTFAVFVGDKNFRELMFETFIKSSYIEIKKVMEKKILEWLDEGFENQTEEMILAEFFINELYYKIYEQAKTKPISIESASLFKIFRLILQKISIESFSFLANSKRSKNEQIFSAHIFTSIMNESDTHHQTNYLLNGQLNIYAALIKRDPSLVTSQKIDYFLHECLIYSQGRTSRLDVKCLSKQNITAVMQILLLCIVKFPALKMDQQDLFLDQENKVATISLNPHGQRVLSCFRELHFTDFWRNRKEWNIDFTDVAKSKIEYVGLQNPGCICYINSLLQQLFMIEQFRYALLNVNTRQSTLYGEQISAQQEDSPNLLPMMKHLFLRLMYSQNEYINPVFFTDSIQTPDRNRMVKIFEQMDIDEFSMKLFDKIQNKLTKLQYPNFIRELFGGMYSNQIISQECEHSSERQEPFLSVSLDLKKTIMEGFQALVKGEMLQGQNAYFCDKCAKKVKALKRLSLKKLPPHLIISLRRFQFDYQIQQRIKLNNYCEFPFQLNMQNYSQDKLNQLTQPKFKTKKHYHPPGYFTYKLKGVVVHAGSADTGHYYSFIQGKNGNWFQFNDEKVEEFDMKAFEDETFGGRTSDYSKTKSAYLLFYERKPPTDSTSTSKMQIQMTQLPASYRRGSTERMSDDNLNQPTASMSELPNIQSVLPTYASSVSKQACLSLAENIQAIEEIMRNNKQMRILHFFFSQEYLDFVHTLLRQVFLPVFVSEDTDFTALRNINEIRSMLGIDKKTIILVQGKSTPENNMEYINSFFRYVVSYTFLIQLRQKNYFYSLDLLYLIKILFAECQYSRQRKYWLEILLNEMCNQSFFDEFFICCNNREKAKIVGHFLYEMIDQYLDLLRTMKDYSMPKVVTNIIMLIMHNITVINLNISQLLLVLRRLLSSRHVRYQTDFFMMIAKFMIQKNFIGTLFDNFLGIQITAQQKQKRLALLNNQKDIFQDEPFQNETQPEEKQKDMRSSDISVAEQRTSAKNKPENNKIEIQGQQSVYTRRPSMLFGMYDPDEYCQEKTGDKETWTILWLIYTQVKRRKEKYEKIMRTFLPRTQINQRNDQSLRFSSQTNQSQNQLGSVVRQTISNLDQNSSQGHQNMSNMSSQRQSQSSSRTSGLINQSQEVSMASRRKFGTESSMNQFASSFKSVARPSDGNQTSNPASSQTKQSQIHQQSNQVSSQNPQSSQVSQNSNLIQIQRKRRQSEEGQLSAEQSQSNVPRFGVGPVQSHQRLGNNRQVPISESKQQVYVDLIEVEPNSGSNNNNPINLDQPQQIPPLTRQQQTIVRCFSQYSLIMAKFTHAFKRLTQQKIYKLIPDQKDTKGIIAFSVFIAEIVSNNEDLTTVLLRAIEQGLKDYESTKYRPFFLLIQKLLELKDDLARERRIDILKLLKNCIRHNTKYFIECDFFHQWILRYCTKNKQFQALLRQNPQFIQEIRQWCNQKRFPGDQTIKKHRQPNCERFIFKLHSIMVSPQIKEYEAISAYKIESFQKIKENKFVSHIKYPEEPVINEEYSCGDRIECFFQQQGAWIEGVVEDQFFGYLMTKFQYGNKIEKYVFHVDDEKIKLKKKYQRQRNSMEIEN